MPYPLSAILITHGTDTLAWTHAAVRYAVKHNNMNIAITGSQIPMPDGVGDYSDAYANIGNSIRFLSQFKPPHIFTVFNNGQNAFSDSLYKINRWDNQAFEGDLIGTMQWDEVKFHDDDVVETTETPTALDTLYVVTTGGTIEATFNQEGVLSPQQNRLSSFIKSKFDNPDTKIVYVPACTIDSSDLTFAKMQAVIEKVKECFEHIDPSSKVKVDATFDENVRIIYTDPFKTEEQYRKEMEGASAVILAGYGGGNINIDENSGFSPLSLIREKSKKLPIVLTSQVALGPADFIYENAWEAVKAGAISGVDLSIPEIQMRLAYLMGHKPQIEDYCASHQTDFMKVVEWLFMSGMKFRTNRSRKKYEDAKGVCFEKSDLLINYTFEESLAVFEKSSIKGSIEKRFVIDGVCYFAFSDNVVEVSRNREIKSEVVIPDIVEYDGQIYRVTKIGTAAFYGNERITSVVIPNSVTEIGEGAFAYCDSLVSVNIPEGVGTIAYETFCGCEKLETLFIPDSVRRVEEKALWYCRALQTISIPKHLLGVEYPKILPKRASDGGQCKGLDNLKHCFVRMPSGEFEEFDVD